MRKVWVVVANSGAAKIYRADNVRTLTEIRDFQHPESHLSERDLVTDRPGRAVGRFGVASHTMEEKTSQKTKERDHFASEIADFLEEGYKKGEIERIYLISPPPFIGFLRQALNDHVSELISEEIGKDLTLFKPEEIRSYLPLIL